MLDFMLATPQSISYATNMELNLENGCSPNDQVLLQEGYREVKVVHSFNVFLSLVNLPHRPLVSVAGAYRLEIISARSKGLRILYIPLVYETDVSGFYYM